MIIIIIINVVVIVLIIIIIIICPVYLTLLWLLYRILVVQLIYQFMLIHAFSFLHFDGVSTFHISQ